MESNTLSPELRAFILAKVLQSLSLYFAHWEDAQLGKEELDAAFEELTREAMACQDRRSFSLQMMAFLARLNNGHTRFLDPDLEALPPLGMRIRPVEGRWTALMSDLPGIAAGDIILDLAGQSAEAWFDAVRPYTVGSPQARTVQFGEQYAIFRELLGQFLPERLDYRVEDAGGKVHTVTVDRRTLVRAAPASSTQGRWLSPSVGYIKVPSFLDPEFEKQALTQVQAFKHAACLVVDVRGNGGGSTPQALTSALINRPYRWWTESSPLNVGLFAYEAQMGHNVERWGYSQLSWHSPARDPDPEAYQGRMIILVDRATWSAAEDFTMPFKDTGRAVIVGETTGGSTGQPFVHTFSNGMGVGIGTKRATLPDGTRFEGAGIVPDVQVDLHREDLYTGHDRVLDKALALALNET
ncbi:MAG: hypothetical protein JXC32_02695 [Anaerolineae bacterium]|nr:hypothetical protein [Anaerolineae bacterium]